MREWIIRREDGLTGLKDGLAVFVEDVAAMPLEDRTRLQAETRDGDFVLFLPDKAGEAVAAELYRFAAKQLS